MHRGTASFSQLHHLSREPCSSHVLTLLELCAVPGSAGLTRASPTSSIRGRAQARKIIPTPSVPIATTALSLPSSQARTDAHSPPPLRAPAPRAPCRALPPSAEPRKPPSLPDRIVARDTSRSCAVFGSRQRRGSRSRASHIPTSSGSFSLHRDAYAQLAINSGAYKCPRR
ncbi:hypothetical protein B0H15DRAFT_853387, partial [Mycena belliarum]